MLALAFLALELLSEVESDFIEVYSSGIENLKDAN